MTSEYDQGEFGQICPYLGLTDDSDSHATYATEAHRCYRLPNPTRIAAGHQETYCLGNNHVSCPVYQGEGIPRPAGAGRVAGAAGAGVAAGAAAGVAAGRGTRSAAALEDGSPRSRGGGAPARPRRAAAPGTLSPRPRAGGISMPAATIGLFTMAIVVVAIAYLVSQMVGGGDENGLSPADTVATQAALRTQTPQTAQTPVGGGAGETPRTGQTTTPAATAATTPTAAAATATPTTASGQRTHTVEAGEYCGTIAEQYDITVDELLEANDMTIDDCTSLQIGQELIIP